MEPLSAAFLTSDAADGHAENDKDEECEHHKDGRHGDDGDVIGGARSRGVLGSGGRGCGRDTCLGEGREGERLKSTLVRDNILSKFYVPIAKVFAHNYSFPDTHAHANCEGEKWTRESRY